MDADAKKSMEDQVKNMISQYFEDKKQEPRKKWCRPENTTVEVIHRRRRPVKIVETTSAGV
ncbi:MAG: hypothetical protein CSA22_01670 [Deltaproteobacteria bacterium]|nr:MAG: hypothetical protein CSA22_01670 [Deltaproteobacteria bacterium]